MRRFITEAEGLPGLSAPISHAAVVDNLCFVSGQLSVASDGSYVPGTIQEEAARAFDNVFAVLRAAEFTPEDICFVQIDFADLGDAAAVNAIFAERFPPGRRPARTIAQAAALPFGGKIKVVAIAAKERH